jgi:hypothetical protein
MPNYIGLLSGNSGGNTTQLTGKYYRSLHARYMLTIELGSARNSVFVNPQSVVGSQKVNIIQLRWL